MKLLEPAKLWDLSKLTGVGHSGAILPKSRIKKTQLLTTIVPLISIFISTAWKQPIDFYNKLYFDY